MGFVGVYTAIYDYSPQAENELDIREGDLLFVLEKSTEDDWWKAKKKATEDEDEEPVGLVPNNYVEKAKPINKAKALYDYTRQTDEEVSFPEDAELIVYDTSDPDWTLVGTSTEYGFAPANYIEMSGEPMTPEESPTSPPPPPARPAQPEPEPDDPRTPSSPTSPADQSPAAALAGVLHGHQASTSSRAVPPPPVEVPKAAAPTYTPEESDQDEGPPPALPRRPPSLPASPAAPVAPASPPRPSPQPRQFVSFEDEEDRSGVQSSLPYNRRMPRDAKSEHVSAISPSGYHLYNINETISIMGKRKKMPTTLGINVVTGTIFISPEKSSDGPHQEWTAEKLTHYSIEGKHVFMDLVRPSKSVDFHAGAKDTAEEIVSALGEIAGGYRAEGLREVIAAGAGGAQKKGQVLYDFMAQGDDEVTVAVGDEVIILDDSKSDEWWMVRRLRNGMEGVVPSSYVEITGVISKPEPSSAGLNAGLSTVEQNRLEEQRMAKESARKSRRHDSDDLRVGEVGPGMKLPDRGSSLLAKTDGNKRSQRSKRDSRSDGKSKPKPDPSKTRKWTDRSGSFTVVAEFIGLTDGKIHLHKQNGVKIAVPVSKMSVEDLEYVEKVTGVSLDEDKPLSDIRRRSQLGQGKAGAIVKPDYDWFDFFLKAGVGPHQCERYAQNFTKDSMDESVLPDITSDVLRSLGLKEGDILRVMKYLDNQYNRKGRDVSFGGEGGEGGLFSGPGGALRNNTRKGRPAPAVQASDVVDPKAFESKTSPTAKPSSPTKTSKSPSPVADKGPAGFEDDAWEVKTPKQPAVSTAPTAPAVTQAAPASQAPPTLTGAMADLNLLHSPLEPTKATPSPTPQVTLPPPVSQPPAQAASPQQPQPTGANPSFFAQLGQQQQQQTTMPPRQRPQPPQNMNQGSSLLPPPPQRPLSAPQNIPQQTGFSPAPLQPQLTGVPQSGHQLAPPGQSLAELNQQRLQPQFTQAQLQPQMTGYSPQGQAMSPFGNSLPPQQTGMMNQQQQFGLQPSQPFMNGPQQPQPGVQQPGFQPLGPQPTGFSGMQQPPQQQPMQTGVNSVLPPALQPQRTGVNGYGGPTSFTPSPPPVPPIPQQPTAAPLQPQKTGPAPPVRFGVHHDTKKLTPQATGLRANLSQATPSNPFGF